MSATTYGSAPAEHAATDSESSEYQFFDLQRLEVLAETAGPVVLAGLAAVYAIIAFGLAVAAVRIQPKGWLGTRFRKHLWLIPLSPLVMILAGVWVLLRGLAVVLGFVSSGLRIAFEKATGQKTYQRQRYSRYYYRKSKTEVDDWFGKQAGLGWAHSPETNLALFREMGVFRRPSDLLPDREAGRKGLAALYYGFGKTALEWRALLESPIGLWV